MWGIDVIEFVTLLVAILALASTVALGLIVGRHRAMKDANLALGSANEAIATELTASKSAAERLGKEKDHAVKEAAELRAHVKVLEARTDLTAILEAITTTTRATVEQIARMTEASTVRIAEAVEMQEQRAADRFEAAQKRSDERQQRMITVMDENHRQTLSLVGSLSSLVTREAERRPAHEIDD